MVSSFLFCWLKKKRDAQWVEERLTLKVPYKCLLKATDGFSRRNLVGAGSFGCVYRGVLNENKMIAVKVLNLRRQGASKSFMAECKCIRHRNLVNIISYCSAVDSRGNNFKALVYEFMPNGNLGRWLHSSLEDVPQTLNLHQRINISFNVACALDYLHNQCPKPIIHCDLKPSNILLDSNMVAHVGDFGLTRFLPELSDTNQRSSIRTRGTIGYAAPEYSLGSEVSRKGDVYSYGILLLEMMTGKKPTDPMFEDAFDHDSFAKVVLPGIILLEALTGKRPVLEDSLIHGFHKAALPDPVMKMVDPILIEEEASDSLNLHSFAKAALPDRVMEIVDPILIKEEVDSNIVKCLISMVRIGVACSMESPEDRMEISKVIKELHLVRDIL